MADWCAVVCSSSGNHHQKSGLFSVPTSWTAAVIAKLPGSCTARQLLMTVLASAVVPLAVLFVWKLLGSHDSTVRQAGYQGATRASDRLSVRLSDRRTAAERRHIWRQEVTAAVAGLAPDIAAVAAGLIISAIAC